MEPGSAPLLSIIVPTLNEGDTIGRLLDGIAQLDSIQGRYEVIVADDASVDRTAAEVQSRTSVQPVRLLQRTGAPDLSAAVLEAARMARGQWVLVMDADGSHPVEIIPELIAPLASGEADLCLGSRHVEGGGIRDWPVWRRWISRTASLLAWPLTGVSDPMSGLFATGRERLLELPIERVGYKILLELLLRTTPEPRIHEVPFRFTDREAGASKMTAAVQWLFIKRLSRFAGARDYTDQGWRVLLSLTLFILLDSSGFTVLSHSGLENNRAHSISFLPAAALLFALFGWWACALNRSSGHAVWRFIIAALLVLVLRGALFSLLLPFGSLTAILAASSFAALIFCFALVFYVFPDAAAPTNQRIRWHLATLGLIIVSLLLRVLYLGQAELIFDEMYYWTYNLYPAWSYLDHPPLTAWLIAIGSYLAGDTVLGVRLMHLVLMPLSLLFAYWYGRAMGGKTIGLLSAALIAIVPAWFASGFLMITDAPLMVAWLAALYGFQRVLIEDQSDGWVIAALAMGLGMLSKYTMAFLVPAVLLFILIHPALRHWLSNWRTWLAGAVTVLIFLPVLIWNYQNDWASFVFQTTRRVEEETRFSSFWLLPHTLVMLAPMAGIAAIYTLTPIRKLLAPDRMKRRFMLIMTLVPLAFLAGFGAFTATKFHWVMPVWLGVLPMIAGTIGHAGLSAIQINARPMLAWLRKVWPVALPATLVVFGLGLQHVTLGLPGLSTKEYRLGYLGWPEIAEAVYELELEVEETTGQLPIVAGMAKWGVAAALSFHDVDGRTDNITARNLVGLSGSQWERWFDHTQSPQRPVILIHHEPKLIDHDWLDGAVIGLGPLEMMIIERDGRPIQRLYYRIADGFRSEQLRYPGQIPE